MLAPQLYGKYKAGHIVAAKHIRQIILGILGYESLQYSKCTSDHWFVPQYLICFSKVTLLLFLISD
jgi:hypothetical protein